VSCGGRGQSCCTGGLCTAANTSCQFGSSTSSVHCEACGGSGQVCCPGGTCTTGNCKANGNCPP
jgi:hypothetical protein